MMARLWVNVCANPLRPMLLKPHLAPGCSSSRTSPTQAESVKSGALSGTGRFVSDLRVEAFLVTRTQAIVLTSSCGESGGECYHLSAWLPWCRRAGSFAGQLRRQNYRRLLAVCLTVLASVWPFDRHDA